MFHKLLEQLTIRQPLISLCEVFHYGKSLRNTGLDDHMDHIELFCKSIINCLVLTGSLHGARHSLCGGKSYSRTLSRQPIEYPLLPGESSIFSEEDICIYLQFKFSMFN